MSILPWGALAEGFLTGKHSKGEKVAESGRNDFVSTHWNERNEAILQEVKTLAQEVNKSPAQVALNWVAQRPRMIPIFGAKSVQQLEDNLGALDFVLSREQMDRLNKVSAPQLFFPHSFESRKTFYDNGGLKVKQKQNSWLV